jgi:putative DNA primase/helicase
VQSWRATSRCGSYIAQHGASRFERHGGETVRDRAGWVRGGGDAGGELEYLILPALWRAEVCAGHDAAAVAAALAEAGHVRRGSDGKPQRTERLPGIGPRRVYVLRASILGEGGENE